MKKIESSFIINQYRSGIESYSDYTKEVGLWDSEKYVFQKYMNQSDQILDLGCGTGRTTFPLKQLGYNYIIGVDLTPEMIERAKELNDHFGSTIEFQVGDATQLNFPDTTFEVVLFSFNGLMSIPGQANRTKAIKEINRVLKASGVFIFTTHDRAKNSTFLKFWEEEKEKWLAGKQDPQLYEFGDLLTSSKNETREIFIHIPSKDEIEDSLTKNNFTVLETFYRIDQFDEPEAVKVKSGECRFWIARKN